MGERYRFGSINLPLYAMMCGTALVSAYLLFSSTRLAMGWRGFFIFMLAGSLAYVFTPLAGKFAIRLGIMDIPSGRKMHRLPTPLLGGVAIFMAFGISAVSTMWYSFAFKGVVYGAAVVFITGVLDDMFDLSSILRLLLQLAAVGILLWHGLIVDSIPGTSPYGIVDKTVTAVWIVGITNAVNFLDGLDGLCVGFGAVASSVFGIIAFLTGQYFLMFLACALVGSCLGFLPWNFRPGSAARIFMGDGGSMFIGFVLASFAIMGEWAENRSVALMVPVLILFLPIFDTTMTTYFRIRDGSVRNVRQWLDYVGKDHFHHRLAAMGIGKQYAVVMIYLVTALLGISAIIIRTGGRLEAYLALLQAGLVLTVFTAFMVFIRNRYERLIEENHRSGSDSPEK